MAAAASASLSRLSRLSRVVALAFVLTSVAGAGCAGCGGSKDGPARGCTLDDGTVIGVGESANVDCNTCVCGLDLELACTERACDDAGPPQEDAGTPDAGVVEEEDAGIVVDEGPCHDVDRDGFYTCIDPDHPERAQVVDCDDERFHVQPGGIELADTPEDDNCDGHNDDFAVCDCGGAATDANGLASAIDLCDGSVVGAQLIGHDIQFGLVDSYQGVIAPRHRLRIDGPDAPPIRLGNDCLMTMGSGDATGSQSDVDPDDCNSSNDCPGHAPCNFDLFSGTCDFADPDPDQTDPEPVIRDLAQLEVTLTAPKNASGLQFDFMFLSQEWPEYLCQIYNDTFYAIVADDSAVAGGAATNAAFDANNLAITVNVGFFEEPSRWTVPLTGTPFGLSSSSQCTSPDNSLFQDGCRLPSYCSDANFESSSGSGSGWLTTSIPVTPGETFTLTFSIHDEGDGAFDSLVLLDAFRWLNVPPTLGTAKEE